MSLCACVHVCVWVVGCGWVSECVHVCDCVCGSCTVYPCVGVVLCCVCVRAFACVCVNE